MWRLLLLIFMISVAEAQPINPPPALPITLQNGGSQMSNIQTTVSTSGTINNQAITTSKLKFTGAGVTLTGLVSDATNKEVLIFNSTGSAMTIANESASSTAANRIIAPNSENYSLPNNQGAYFWYDTSSSRWRITTIGLKATSPITITNGVIAMPQASGSVSGYLSSTDFTTFTNGILWRATGNDIYNLNSESVLLTRYECSTLTTYATCNAQVATGCTVVSANDCNSFGDESSCNTEPQCSWDGSSCSGSYFSECTGVYRVDDNSGAKLQVNSATECFGTAEVCSGLSGVNCTDQDGCSLNPNTCPDQTNETDCTNAGCGAFINCSQFNGDQVSCEADANCSWSDPDCGGDFCPGDNSSCTGTATACSAIVGASNCADQDGCTYGVSPAIRAQGDTIVTSDGFLQFLKTYAGTPTAGDCDAAGELGRFSVNTVSGDLCYCSGTTGWYCIDPTPASGGGNSVTVTMSFGGTATDKAQTVVTGQTWVTVNSEITCQVKTPSGTDPDEIRLLDFDVVVSDLVAGTGFTATLYSGSEATGDYDLMCIGI
jgi:hypothetical protein